MTVAPPRATDANVMAMSGRLHRDSVNDSPVVEETSAVKHEDLDGEIHAMARGSVLHAARMAVVSGLDGRLDVGALYADAGVPGP